jgi:hypothetical protein
VLGAVARTATGASSWLRVKISRYRWEYGGLLER